MSKHAFIFTDNQDILKMSKQSFSFFEHSLIIALHLEYERVLMKTAKKKAEKITIIFSLN